MRWKTPPVRFTRTLVPLEDVQMIVIHHAAHPKWGFYDVHRFHRDVRSFGGIGYNFWVSKRGSIYRGRGFSRGRHVKKWNDVSIGIGFQGDFDKEEMGPRQFEAGVKLVTYLIRRFALSIDHVCGHSDLASISCPGRNFPLEELKRSVKKAVSR